jgi:integrase
VKLTADIVANLTLPKGKTEHIFFDDDVPGLGLRMREGGSRTWVLQYRLGTRQRRMKFAAYPALPLSKAREQAGKLHAKAVLGTDPAHEKQENKARARDTFEACVEAYLEYRRTDSEAPLRGRSLGEVERHLTRNLKPLNAYRIDKVTQAAVADELSRLNKDAGRVQSNRTRASLVAFLNWCAGRGKVTTNVAAFTQPNKEANRIRVLKETELRTLWLKLDEMGDDYAAIVRLLMLTGARAAEIGGLRWSEVHLAAGTVSNVDLPVGYLEIPGNRTKNGRTFIIPLTEAMKAILQTRKRNRRACVFGIGASENGFSGWSKAKAALDELVKLDDYVIHDIRRSCATHMARIGIQPHIIEACLNHVSGAKGGIAGIYNQYAYLAEKTAALQDWSEETSAIIEQRASNIAAMRKERARREQDGGATLSVVVGGRA